MQVFNTRIGKKEELITLEPGVVRGYICGPTVYDYCHMGHARTYINFDVFRRYLEALGYRFIHVQNFTDIDDKISGRASDLGKSPLEVAEGYIAEYFKDMDALNIKRATVYTRVSEFVPKIADAVKDLLARGLAYRSDRGIYFDVQRGGGFGELVSGIEEAVTDKVEPGKKRGPFDFALWIETGEREQGWDSVVGRGRPGWHIQCVVMSTETLGRKFDVHWGGMDLIYPHHECEALLSKALFGSSSVRYWIHNNFVVMGGDKMSKSSGRIAYIRDVLDGFPAPAIRTYLLGNHYREKIEYSEAGLESAERRYKTIREGAALARRSDRSAEIGECVKEYAGIFFGAIDDDLKTGEAIAVAERLALEIIEAEGSRSIGSNGKDFTGAWRIFDAVEQVLGIDLS